MEEVIVMVEGTANPSGNCPGECRGVRRGSPPDADFGRGGESSAEKFGKARFGEVVSERRAGFRLAVPVFLRFRERRLFDGVTRGGDFEFDEAVAEGEERVRERRAVEGDVRRVA